MTIAAAGPFIDRRTAVAVLGLGVTQIVGWGTTYAMPAVLGRFIAADLGLASELVFAGVTVMFAVSALTAPAVGRRVDRLGARGTMATGSLMAAVALALLSQSGGLAGYVAAWIVIGLATSLMLQTAPMVALAQIAGGRARRAFALLSILGGLASTTFWPLGGALEVTYGWRGVLLIFAGLHIVICLPIHLLVLPASPQPPQRAAAAAASAIGTPYALPERHRTLIFTLLAATFSISTLVYFGVGLQMIEILRGLGHSAAAAVFVASLTGPAQVSTRAIEVVFGNRYSAMDSALASSLALPAGLAIALFAGGAIEAALLAVLLYGIANGLKTVVRAALPLALYGHAGYGAVLGRLAVPQNIVAAIAPVVFAALVARASVETALWTAMIAAVVALVALLALRRLVGSGRT
ncbi:MAG: MFS transporter [Alphaproteobacteria bacterium]|nr:MFS transporter [Alphaproteobacteria bacterium]